MVYRHQDYRVSRNFIHALHVDTFIGVDAISRLLTIVINLFPQTIDTSQWPVSSQSLPWTQVELIFPKSPSGIVEAVLRGKRDCSKSLVRSCFLVPDYAGVFGRMLEWVSTELDLG
jgi:hypothetical protein